MNQDDIRLLNELKILSIDMISRAQSGSPGLVLSMAPVVYTLFQRHLNVRPNEPNWINRDRIVLSSGNASSLLYAAMHIAGYPIKKEDLMNYRSLNSITPGYPEYGRTPGIEVTSGLFGEGIANAVGMSLSRRYIQSLINQEDERLNILDYDVYCLCTEKDMMEGVSSEALSFAASQKLDHLFFLYDASGITEDGDITTTVQEDIVKKYQSLGFYVDYLKSGFTIKDIDKAISSAKRSGRPAILIFKTILGKESLNENKSIVYSKPLTVDDVANLRKKWNIFLPPFEISKDSIIYLQKCMNERTNKKYKKWQENYQKALNTPNEKIKQILQMLQNNQSILEFRSEQYKINDGYREPLTETNSKILNLIAGKSNLFLGGCADSSVVTHALINNSLIQNSKNPIGRNIQFGAREHAMASILNGMALNGLSVFGSTKLIYADYLKPAIRLTALMNLPITYIFTHDTISVGEDGPVLEPIEQLSLLRTIPNFIVYRPSDIMEVMGSWETILEKKLPAALIITQNDSPKLPGTDAKSVKKGAYIIKRENQRLDGILISCGSELIYALQIAYDLERVGINLRVVSMPSMELFLGEGKEYEQMIFPNNIKRIVIEAGSPHLWNRFASDSDSIIALNEFGYSAHPLEIQKQMGFDYESLKEKVEGLLK